MKDTLENLQLCFNSETGIIESIFDSEQNFLLPISAKFTLSVGGHEVRSPTGGIEYRDCLVFDGVYDRNCGEESFATTGNSISLPITFGQIKALINFELGRYGSTVSLSVSFREQNELVRNLTLDMAINLGTSSWVLHAPGNGVRSGLAVSELTDSTGISALGGLRGSSALAHLYNGHNSLVLWCDNLIEVPEILLGPIENGVLQYQVRSNFASDLAKVEEEEVPLVTIQLGDRNWESFSELFQEWLIRMNLRSPASPPTWAIDCMIYEVQIGFSVFGTTNTYSPYATVKEVIADISRIEGMGFRCLQLMPKQPYPSYNVHDYFDIETSYGPVDDLIELITLCHAKGIRVILDVLLHGVLDQEIIGKAADGVRNGPFASLLSAETGDSFSSDVKDWSNYAIAWSRHILDFEPYWTAGSPPRTELEDTHPEWFYRDSAGEIAGVYTKAFDAIHLSWQNYFIEAMLNLVKILNVDGFRFDAPSYNDFPNWSPSTRHRASASQLACVRLFERMRPIFKNLNPDFLFYTEPSGLALRKSMDLNYNYDEQWLVTAIASPLSRTNWGVNSGKQLATWFADRDISLPKGSLTAHHLDSHDTFWWPTWGNKWRREQFGLELTRMLYVIFGTLPGPFMLFVGGEEGIEDLIRKIAEFKSIISGSQRKLVWWLSSDTPEEIFALTYVLPSRTMTVLVNCSENEITFNPEWSIGIEDTVLIGNLFKISGENVELGRFGYLIIEKTT